jgi:F0F1-type ATP synthase assembly protein I
MQLALTMLFFVGGGHLLDRWLGTAPWFLLVGSVLGIMGVFISIFYLVRRLSREDQKAGKTHAGGRSSEDTPATDD